MTLAQNLNLQEVQNQAGLNSFPSSVGGLISTLIPYFFYIGGALLLIYLILGGFQIMFSRGDPKAVQGGWGKVTNAVIGFIIIFLAFSITNLLGKVFGIDAFTQIFGR